MLAASKAASGRRRSWWALAVVGVLAIVGVIVAQTEKPKVLRINVPAEPQTIAVVKSGTACVSANDESKPVGSAYSVSWQAGSGVSFHVIFPGKSPSHGGEKYFDRNNYNIPQLKAPVNGVAEAFEYVISVDGGSTCDPHVIIVQ
jgi:hypothetical protein